MKKQYLTIALMAAAIGMTACSSKTPETTAAVVAESTEAASEAAAEAEQEEEDVEEEYFHGSVTEADDKTQVITVQDSDGKEAKFDISQAELMGAEAVKAGDEVEIAYTGELSDATAARSVDIYASQEEDADIVVSGTITAADDKTLTLETAEGTYTFNTIIAQKVTKDGLKEGSEAEVTYYGDPEDTVDLAVATRIVTEDAMDSEDAEIYTLTGTVVEAEAGYIVLDTKDPENTFFSFVGPEDMFENLKVGDTATVIYEGTLTAKAIMATGVK
ncbi:hypothetical protein [Lacrimispora sp. 210928-DFI.3.58]|uniref:hypothetical protein n=1 Tax=Lacrimispora sp. 210928-DFI.3.58 TaxID=2883214 RepID=UPI0015B60E1E|nr:hypothetical protein [Lacrimispora sp. 210928-DFI.3.58]MCB7318821.1 hypothetical protein [Lacrimispora sp. 210928-DFI.3.58]